jgi:hypothetical protein
MRKTLLALAAGLCLLLPAYFGSRFTGGILSPVPILPFIFGDFLQQFRYWIDVDKILVIFPMLLFFVWNPGLLRGQLKIPRRTYLLVAAVIALSFVDFVGSWRYGLKYQGVGYTCVVDAINFGWIAILCFLSFRNWKGEPSFLTNLAVHWIFFAWIAWYAFPWLGEAI